MPSATHLQRLVREFKRVDNPVDKDDTTRIPLTVSRGCVVASVQRDLRGAVLQQFRTDLLERLQDSGVSGVIIDLSGVRIMDAVDFDGIRRTLDMAALMGARTVLVGLRPGVVSALVQLDVDTGNVDTLLDLDDGFALFESTEVIDEDDEEQQTPEEEELEGNEKDSDFGMDPDLMYWVQYFLCSNNLYGSVRARKKHTQVRRQRACPFRS
jgi:rsbT antagonist protein RsbS